METVYKKLQNHNILMVPYRVLVKPNITLPTKDLSQRQGQSTVLTCIIDAFPMGIMYWAKRSARIENFVNDKFKYRIYVS